MAICFEKSCSFGLPCVFFANIYQFVCVCASFPFDFEGRILDLTVLISGHCLSFLSYDVSIIQWITLCHKNHTTTSVIILWRVDVTSLTTSVSTVRFRIEILSILKAIRSNFKGSYNKHYWSFYMKFIKLAEGSFHKFHMK